MSSLNAQKQGYLGAALNLSFKSLSSEFRLHLVADDAGCVQFLDSLTTQVQGLH